MYVGGYHTEAGLILRQAKEQGLGLTQMGGDALVVREFWQIAGAAGEGTLLTFAPVPRGRPAAAAAVARRWLKRCGSIGVPGTNPPFRPAALHNAP